MPPRIAPNQQANMNGNHRSDARSGKGNGRPKREENKGDDVVAARSVITKLISNTAKTSSGKSFVSALRASGPRSILRQEEPATPEVEDIVAPEPGASAVEEPVVEAAATPVDPQPEPVAIRTAPVEEVPVVEKQPVVADKPQQPPLTQRTVTLPESNSNFSWANDDDYSFANDLAPQHPVETSQAKPMLYAVTYPAEVIEGCSKGPRIAFEAPPGHQRIDSAMDRLARERAKLDSERRELDEERKKWQKKMTERETELSLLQDQLDVKEKSLQGGFSKLTDQQQLLQQQQQVMQQQQQQQQQQQSVPIRPIPSAVQGGCQPQLPPPPPQQASNNYTYQTGTQDNMQWNSHARSDHWGPNPGVMVPPYDHGHYYGGPPYQQPARPRNFTDRGADFSHMNRGNQMRGAPHMGGGFQPGRPLGTGDGRGPVPDTGNNPMFSQRNAVGYMGHGQFNRW